MKYKVSALTINQLSGWGADVPEILSLSEIICNGEMAKAFFGEEIRLFKVYPDREDEIFLKSFNGHTQCILTLLQKNKQEEAEAYLLANTIFNPSNK